MAKDRPKKIRADFRKNRAPRARQRDFTREFDPHDEQADEGPRDERLSGKGDLTRKRTILADDASADANAPQPVVDMRQCVPGRVLSLHGLRSAVELDDGRILQCATRRLLKTLSIDQRHVVATGDQVLVRPIDEREGLIERVAPRHGVLSRTSRGRQHIIVTNVDQLLIVTSAAQPNLKPNLIDRFLVTAEASGVPALICINKVDLIDPVELMPLAGVYAQLGYDVLLASAQTGLGIERLRRALVGRETAVAGQSGVGKSSILNAIDPQLKRRVAHVSLENQKGRHTTSTAVLLRLEGGGYVVDTPGIRQFQLWDIVPAELASQFREFRPFVSRCRFPDCTHIHEDNCAVKDAVADDLIDARRYESYCNMFEGAAE